MEHSGVVVWSSRESLGLETKFWKQAAHVIEAMEMPKIYPWDKV